VKARFLVISFTSDWLYPSYQSLETCAPLRGPNRRRAYCELPSNYGHDAFLVDVGEQTKWSVLPGEHVQGENNSVPQPPAPAPARSARESWAVGITPSSAENRGSRELALDAHDRAPWYVGFHDSPMMA